MMDKCNHATSIMEHALQLKGEGKDFFLSKQYEKATEKYQQAIDYIATGTCSTPFQSEADIVRITCLSNIAMCHYKNGNYTYAILACNDALEKGNTPSSDNIVIKLLYRRGMCHLLLSKLPEAKSDLMIAYGIDRDNVHVQKGLIELKDRMLVERDKQKERDLYSGMFSSGKVPAVKEVVNTTEENVTKDFHSSSSDNNNDKTYGSNSSGIGMNESPRLSSSMDDLAKGVTSEKVKTTTDFGQKMEILRVLIMTMAFKTTNPRKRRKRKRRKKRKRQT